jgi:prepilin-type N-terminal cleavage/methylation domain-containing protein
MSHSSLSSAVSCAAPQGRRRAFTLVELLVVILILAILMAVALPLYLGAIRTSTRRVARHNMRTLANANVAFRTQTQRFTDNPADFQQAQILTNIPEGPGGTQYTIYVFPDSAALPDGRTLTTGETAVCGADSALGANGDYGCYVPGKDSE